MITVAIDTASLRCTVALSDGTSELETHVDGHRRHAGAILGMVGELLGRLGAEPRDISRLLLGDGPGSFTGLRVAAAVASAIAWQRDHVSGATAPSLLVRAMPFLERGGGNVLALSDALRGELYAGCWRIEPDRVVAVGPPPAATSVAGLARFGAVAAVIGSIPDRLLDEVAAATGQTPLPSDAALPDARALLALDRITGGTRELPDLTRWEPEYGRPVAAAIEWERKHGRGLPAQTSHPG